MPQDILPGEGTSERDVASTTRPHSSSQKIETYEDLEDPFALDSQKIPEIGDPFEGYNRFMYDVNEGFYDYLMEPVARGYRYVLPDDIRIAIRNLFNNALFPVRLVSSLLQGDLDKSGRVLSRVVINTTIGLGGLFDVAGNHFEIKNVQEDFDQALGYHGVPTGPYVVLPFLGPSTARNVVGRVVDSVLSPTIFSPTFLIGFGITFADNVNETSFIIDDKKQLEESAVDEYISIRDFYHQYREVLVRE
ncbi:MAG: VacJ family lipoprotein [Nitrospinota bacterium]|nr:VacJ family lipoprotein [Nitrospinota bacterium]